MKNMYNLLEAYIWRFRYGKGNVNYNNIVEYYFKPFNYV